MEYHLGKANVVADALSGKIVAALKSFWILEELLKDVSVVSTRGNDEARIVKGGSPGHFLLHLGSIKKYRNLRSLYWWPGMKKEISEYVSSCITCQQVKIEHQVPSRKLYLLENLEWKWDKTTMDSDSVFALNDTKKNTVWEMKKKLSIIRTHLKADQDRQKAYTNKKRKDILSEVGDKVFLKVSPWIKVIRFGLKENLSLHFIRLDEVLE
ncbi:uncharacterized protein LOC105779020 [Gossypium raimondii]|uniref:uncharacterized protein LOC105779020 n=1 Tax=Gossypium raimondii TaxID=29730 RepID=UPI00063A99CB|nr:uncharacterized protein LOC105779020 [Gossypium raimondii]